MTNKVIENAKLVELIGPTQDQVYRYGSNVTDTIILRGLNKAQHVKVGDTGKLVYQTTRNSGLYYFYKYKTNV